MSDGGGDVHDRLAVNLMAILKSGCLPRKAGEGSEAA